MTTSFTTSTTDSQMHNNIMAAGSRNRPPMLATGRYAQWRSRFLRYIDTRPKGDALRKCILEGPYQPTTVTIPAVPATENSLEVPERTTVETILTMSPENKDHYESEKEAIHLILTGIGDEIYSTVDACKTAHEMWEAIERLQQGESLNIQDVKTNLFWEFGKFTSHDGETIESYYTRKLRNSVLKNRPECYLLALVDTAQTLQIHITKTSSHTKSYAPTQKPHFQPDLMQLQDHKGKEIANQSHLYSESPFDGTNDNQTGQFGNQRAVNVDEARDTLGGQVVKQSGILCFNCKEFGHFTKECRKPKQVKTPSIHRKDVDEVPNADSCTDSEPLEQVAFDLLRDALSAIFGLSELKTLMLSLSDLSFSGGGNSEGSAAANSVMHVSADGDRGVQQKGRPELASDEELEGPMKDQPLSADASPTALSPGYIVDFDPEEDKEDPEEDPADHPADG
ncbi:retrovirus-related pol polyprotein from transposon TNT 1-94 [Tanacetum coccineum]|uniref:Retrovirus-related pol polyprotein from transposon TNT 1-94 n=1 Tax=Tanacetum coccineum TaxID=301880 RepID=A0ABQ5GWD4_9ASTR